VSGSSQGTSYPESGPYLDHRGDPRVADVPDRPGRGGGESGWYPQASSQYRGSSRTRPRRGQARAPTAVPGHVCGHQCTAVSPALLRAVGGREEACRRFCQVRLTFGDNPFGGIACWGGTQAWVEIHVPDVYRRGYLATVLPELRATRGGGVSLRAVKLVALVMAQAAEHSTGRGSRLRVATIMARTGLGESTVQRARTALRLLGVATEVFRGRLRTYTERMASWRVGDRARGWASVWALHPPTPVDKTRIVCAGQTLMAPHPRRGLSSLKSSSSEVVTTGRAVHSRAASRRSTRTTRRKLSLPDPRGAVLASRWLRDGRTPGWARQHTPTGWARVLAEPARYGWNVEDLNAIITDWATDTGVAPAPTTPVAFLRWLLQRHDLAFSPTLLDHARRDQERAAAQERRQAAAQELARSAQARATAQADLHGPGHQLAHQVLDQASRAAAERKAAAIRAEHAARAAAVARARHER